MGDKDNRCPVWFGRMLFAAVFFVFMALVYAITPAA